ncbi:MAG: hypothetical protein K6F78_07015 [Bacteroidaceae bacterium]|nr:hypothetical protein [Bacteroidaceae bacterium]
MTTEDKNKRLVNIEIEDDVKRLTITGQDENDQVVMKQELSDDELDGVAGGGGHLGGSDFVNRGKDNELDNVAGGEKPFYGLFAGAEKLVSSTERKLVLPATTLKEG